MSHKPTSEHEVNVLQLSAQLFDALASDFRDSLEAAKADGATAEQLALFTSAFMLASMRVAAVVGSAGNGSWLSVMAGMACTTTEVFDVADSSSEGKLHQLFHNLLAEFGTGPLPTLHIGGVELTRGGYTKKFGDVPEGLDADALLGKKSDKSN